MEREPNLLIRLPRKAAAIPCCSPFVSVIVGCHLRAWLALPSGWACSEPTSCAIPLLSGLMDTASPVSFSFVSGTALAAGVAAWMVVRFSPEASGGSGIPHVENQLKKRWSGDPARIAPVKFCRRYSGHRQRLGLGPGRPHRAYWRQHRSSARENVPAATNMNPELF